MAVHIECYAFIKNANMLIRCRYIRIANLFLRNTSVLTFTNPESMEIKGSNNKQNLSLVNLDSAALFGVNIEETNLLITKTGEQMYNNSISSFLDAQYSTSSHKNSRFRNIISNAATWFSGARLMRLRFMSVDF